MSSIAHVCFEPIATTGTKAAMLERLWVYAPGEIMFDFHKSNARYGDVHAEVEGFIWAYAVDTTGRMERNESAHEKHLREMDDALLRSMG